MMTNQTTKGCVEVLDRRHIKVDGKITDAIVEIGYFPQDAAEQFENARRAKGLTDEEWADLFEKACAAARKVSPGIDRYTEYENGFVFWSSSDDDKQGHGPVCVRKKDGKVMTMAEFTADGTGKDLSGIIQF